ncbi:MAG: alanine racemase [Candidatus Adiutrix sp.]|jgi:alanine racemase|nr:alanine racemase [Candidatus Adiutrix sp.]
MSSIGRPTWAEVDLSAIRRNVAALKSLLRPGVRFCAVVKANGYGHGAAQAAGAALRAGADYLAVAILDEALALRSAGLTAPILILGYTPPAQSHLVAENNLTQTIYNLAQAVALGAAGAALGRAVKVHLKVDTGMGRLGVEPGQAADFARSAARQPGLLIEGLYTHFAQADSRDKTSAAGQLAAFQSALAAVAALGLNIPLRHAANSAALLDLPESHLDMVRAGISLYGLWPSEETSRPVELSPALKFKTTIALLKRVPAGTPLSYGHTHLTTAPADIATLPVGYADGWPRNLSGRAVTLAGGRRAKVVGRICMDQCLIDVTAIPGLAEGDEVLLFGGPDLPVEEPAALLGTINYELVCQVGQRVPRVYREGQP